MSDDQIPFDHPELVANPEPRCACLLLLDTSGSMHGQPMTELNAGLATFKDELMADPMAMQRVEVAVVSFGPVRAHSDFQNPDTWTPPQLEASGDTPMGAAIEHGLQMLENRKQVYRQSGITYYRPWVFLLTDGGPTDSWRNAASLVPRPEPKFCCRLLPAHRVGQVSDVGWRVAYNSVIGTSHEKTGLPCQDS